MDRLGLPLGGLCAMIRDLDPDELRRAFPPLVGENVSLHNVQRCALHMFPDLDHPEGEPRIGVSLTFVGTAPEDSPDVMFVLDFDQAQGMRESLGILLDRARGHESG